MKLEFANTEQRKAYWKNAQDWAQQQDWAYYRKDEFPAIKGVAEFLANQDGLTLFEGWEGREYNEV